MKIPLPRRLMSSDGLVGRLNSRLLVNLKGADRRWRKSEGDVAALLRKAFDKTVEVAELPSQMAEVAPLVRRPVEIHPDEGYPELGVRSFGRGMFHKPTLDGSQLTWQKLFRINEGDLVFSNIKAWEGAFAVAEAADDGRVGSHRYLTCIPVYGLATARFIFYYLQTPEGTEKIAAASPGSADRNRTLGQKRLGAVEVPVPSIKKQRRFDCLHAETRALRATRAEAEDEVVALIPAMLHEVFEASVDARV